MQIEKGRSKIEDHKFKTKKIKTWEREREREREREIGEQRDGAGGGVEQERDNI